MAVDKTLKEKYMGKLEGKTALITADNSGIGFMTAKQFVNEGAYVFIMERHDQELAAAVKEIGRNVTAVQGDVSNLGDLDRLFAQVKREEGKLDIVFADAGAAYTPLGEMTEEHYASIFNINVKGLFFTVQKALPLLPDGASIILNASGFASEELSANIVYAATKAAVRSFARTWTTDLQDRRIRVNEVPLGRLAPDDIAKAVVFLASDDSSCITVTELVEDDGLISNNVPLGRLVATDEIAEAVAFRSSDDSSYITGMELRVDGGTLRVLLRPLRHDSNGPFQG